MTLFGLIWFVVIFIAFMIKDIRAMIFVTIIGMIWQCNNMVDLESFKCGPQLITSIFFVVKTYCYKIENKNKKNPIFSNYKLWILFILYILINFLMNFGSISFNNIVNCMILFIYVFTFYRLIYVSSYMEKKDFEKLVNMLTTIILIFGVIQLLVVVLNIPRNSLIKYLVYNDIYSIENIFYYKSYFRFYSTFMEPSYVAGLLVCLLGYYIFKDSKSKSDLKYIILLNIAIILTFSSTAYILYAIVMLIYAIKNYKKKRTALILPIVVILIVGIGFKSGIFDKVLFNKLSTKSGQVRTIWNNHAISVFEKNRYFGIGYKTLRASSIIYDILGELGIVGLSIYFIILINNLKNLFSKKNNYFFRIFSLGIVIMFIGQMIACPDIDLCSFWLVMYLYALSSNLNSIKGEKNI